MPRTTHAIVLTACLMAAGFGVLGSRSAQASHPDLFYNYYVGPPSRGAPAQLYLSPRPVPAHVGHTYITYQPLMPHEFLYRHKRHYYKYYPDGGYTRTHVRWW